MTLARTRRLVAAFGIVVLAAIVAGFAVVGGPDTGRRDRRDAARLDAVRQIAGALECHVEAAADPARPATIGEITPACLAPDAAQRLADPRTRAPYRIEHPAADRAAVCADFEASVPTGRAAGWPPFDAETGCVSVNLAR